MVYSKPMILDGLEVQFTADWETDTQTITITVKKVCVNIGTFRFHDVLTESNKESQMERLLTGFVDWMMSLQNPEQIEKYEPVAIVPEERNQAWNQ